MATFEELAERLAGGATPQARIEAAERLAEADDPRVAPTLARALADPSAAVRERVEALLAEFGRRDHTGTLQALLDEAERVSAALTAEVGRLRGDEPPEAEIVAEPIEPPEGFDGDCVVVRLDARPVKLKRMCGIVAEAIGQALFAVTREVHLTKGILARSAPAAVARQLVRDLAAAGVPAAAAPAAWLPEPPDLVRVRDPVFGPAALRGVVVPEGGECEAAWETVELVVAGRIEVELKRGKADEDWSPFTRPLRGRGQDGPLHELGYEYALEVYGGEPLARLRLLTRELDFETMQRRPSGLASVARLARGLLGRVARPRLAAGVRRLAERDRDNWDDLTFLSPLAFEDYVAWQRLLLALGAPLPRDPY